MKSIAVKDLMIPIGEYATVSHEATLYEAVEALQKAQKEFVGVLRLTDVFDEIAQRITACEI